jgi:hypothetical protein
LLLALLVFAAAGCGDDPVGRLVVGLTSDFRAGTDLDRLDIVMKVDGEVLQEQTLSLGTSAGKTNFPAEFAFTDVPDGATLTIDVRGYEPSSGMLRVVRHVETTAVGESDNLVRIHLENDCMLRTQEEADEAGIPSAPTCNEGSQTCIGGGCASAQIPAGDQEAYTANWATNFGDICKPADGGTPEVIVGQGQSDYLASEDYALAQVEAGPQGGHHVWVSARVRNLHQSGSITTVGGEIPALMLSITPLKVIFTFDPDEGGYCKIFGLRFQLDVDLMPGEIDNLLGEEARVVITVTDSEGDEASDDLWLTLSDTIL